MLVAQRVNDYITGKRPGAVCDGCIVNELDLTKNAHAAQITAALGTTTDFERNPGECVVCGGRKKVIGRN